MSLKRVRGTEDLKGDSQQQHNFIVDTARKVAHQFCFQEISTPVFELSQTFSRTLGPESDIVNKEMFTFEDRSGTSLTLRPEGTAGVARHFITENLHQQLPLRFFYQGSMFRYERPQKGRLRQFHTVGVELLGESAPRGDVECICLAYMFFQKLQIEKKLTLEINSIGDVESRDQHRTALVEYLKPLKGQLSVDSRRRLKTNPLRILDSKEDQDRELLKKAPVIKDFLNPRSQDFFAQTCEGLDKLGLSYKINPLLVRGLDYYNHCVFEFKAFGEQMGAQNTVLAGGRYDRLVEIMAEGGQRIHGTGWGAGIERIKFLLSQKKAPKRPLALVPLGEEAESLALKLSWDLRQAGLTVFHPRSQGNLSKKMKRAVQMQGTHALIFGPEEIKSKKISIKNLDQKTQESVPVDQVVSFFKNQTDVNP